MKPITLALLIALSFSLSCSRFFPRAENTNVPRLDTEPVKQAEEERAQPKRRILLLGFLNHSPYQEASLNQTVWEQVRRTVSQNPQFTLVTEEELGGHLPYTVDTSEYDNTAVFRVARNHGFSGVIGGVIQDIAVSESGDDIGVFRSKEYVVQATVKLQLFDTRSESEVFSRVETAEVNEELTTLFGSRTPTASDPERMKGAVARAVEQVAQGLTPYLKRVEWVGRIAKIDLHRYYINAGELSGIRVGQLLKVYGDGTAIRDEISGSFLGVAPGPFKGILKVVDYFGSDGAVAVVHSGAGFRQRDQVELLAAPK